MNIYDSLPKLNLETCHRLLCVQPHPDDNEVGAGATIAKLTRVGCEVVYLTVTDGRLGSTDPSVNPGELIRTRRRETEASAGVLGVSRTLYLDYADASYPDEKELSTKIVSVIRSVQPELVMTVDPFLPYEAHPDHRRVGMAVSESVLFASFPHFDSMQGQPVLAPWQVGGIAYYNTAYPNTFIDVDQTWDRKLKALAAHSSQFSGEYANLVKLYLEFKARQYAEGKGFIYAEAFKVLPAMFLHGMVDAV
ncbi:MAG TPA: PIG-L deacetylase family protein, partial [Bacillota bacterium]|nr:PIG-L deacetylase family protein [Bacillota bacterium]